jgi:5-methylcytosine-specific restriction protein A
MRQRREDPVKRRALAFYSSKAWREARASWLADHPLCVDCLADKQLVAATVVDHIVEINAGGAMLDAANFQSLCHTCHSKKTRRDGGAW